MADLTTAATRPRPPLSPILRSDLRSTLRSRIARSPHMQAAALIILMVVLIAAGIIASLRISASIDQLLVATVTSRSRAVTGQQVLTTLLDAETGQRGFLLTGRASYLAPYNAAIERIEPLLLRLGALTVDAPEFQDEYRQLETAAHAKIAELRQTIMTAERQGIPAAVEVVDTDAGRLAMEQARQHIAIIIERAGVERAERADRLITRQRQVTTVLLASLGAAVILLGGAALLLVFNRARLVKARTGELREAARLEAAVEHVRDGLAVFDEQERLTLANARFASALGVPPALVARGVSFATIAAAVMLDPPLLAGGYPGAPVVAEAREAGRTLEVWRSPMPDGGQMLGVIDISRRVAAEEAARQSQKMEVLGQMTGGVAHDFNNLLQVVSANLELLRGRIERRPDNAALLARLEAAETGVARGARLTRHLLAFARRQPLAPEPLDAARQLTGLEDLLRRTLGESIRLELVIGGGLWFMRADPTQFENAMLNLALNARDAMTGPDGVPTGRLTIEAANAALDDAYAARVADVAPGQYVMFAVTDTGSGMTQDQLGRALEPFYTTKAEGRGTGLGLPMVLGFAKQSGGHFQLYSEPGHGTTARLYIPRSSAPAIRPEQAQPASPAGQGELLLLVEDDAQVRHVAHDALTGLGYQVIEAENADAALQLLERGCAPRLLFTDVVMPGEVTARVLASRAKALIPGLAVLFTSGYTQNSIVHNGQLDPDVALLSKPWRTEDLARAIRAALDGAAGRPAPRVRVLLVEDEELVRMTTADTLAGLGYDVLEAGTGAAALARLVPAPDLVLADLGLPDRDGLDLVHEMRRRIPGLPVIIATSHPRRPGSGLIWIDKPYNVQTLRNALDEALANA